MSSEMQFLNTITIDQLPQLGSLVFDEKTGGDADASNQKHRPGGMGPQQIYPALKVFSTITLTRVFDNENRNDSQIIPQIEGVAGESMCTVSEQPLDANGVAFGSPSTWRGMLTGVHRGNTNSDSESLRMWEVVVDPVTANN